MTPPVKQTPSETIQCRTEALKTLRGWLKPGQEVYTVCKHVSRSGMLRHIDVFAIVDGKPQSLNRYVEALGLYNRAKDFKANNADSLRVSGCGMDMGFAVVYDLSSAVFKDAFRCVGKGCPSNDHCNGEAIKKGKLHSDAGYALRQVWR